MPRPTNCVGPGCSNALGDSHKGPPFCSDVCQAAKKAEGAKRAAQQKAAAAAAAAEKKAAAEVAAAAKRTESCLACGATGTCEPDDGHCPDCVKLHSGDTLTFVYLNDGEICASTFDSANDGAEFVRATLELLGVLIKVLLDLHGVTNKTDPNTPLGADAGVISYVGKHSTTRYDAFNDIQARLRAGQIHFGALVFKRGKRVKGRCQPTQEPGSKAWFCSLIPSTELFVDDSPDHVDSVDGLDDGPVSVLFNPRTSDELPLPEVIRRNLNPDAFAS